MRKTKLKIVLALLVLISLMLTNTVYAAGSFSVSAGGTMNVSSSQSLTITTSGCAGKFSVKSSNPAVVAVSSSSVFVDGSEKVGLTAKGAGTATITVTAVDVLDPSYNEVTGSKSVTITVKGNENTGGSTNTGGNTGGTTSSGNNTPAPKPPSTTTKSNVATLKTVGINPNDFSGFKPGKYNYSVTVGNEVDKVTVYATTTHNKATWSVSGANVAGVSGKTVSLKEGTNNIYINVKAEDGTKAKYTIAVTRKSAEGEIIPNVIEDQEFEQVGITEALGLKSLEVEKLNLNPEFATEVYEYTITVENEELLSLEDLKNIMKYEANFENALIEVSSEKEDFEYGENLVYIIVKDAENEVAKYTLKVILEEEEEVLTIGAIEENTVTEEKTSIPKERIISIISMSLLGVISVIIMIRYYMVSQRLEIFENEIDIKDFENTKSTTTVKENVEVKEETEIETEESRSEKIDKLTEKAPVEQERGFEYRRPGGRRRKGGKHRER